MAEAARNRITVRSFRTNYKIDWWGDGRVEPYRVIYNKFSLKSIYTFEASGSLKTLTVGNTQYTFNPSIEANGTVEVQEFSTESRMLRASEDDEAIEGVDSDFRRLYDCEDCEET